MTRYAVQDGMQVVVAIGTFAAGAPAASWQGHIVQQALGECSRAWRDLAPHARTRVAKAALFCSLL